MFDEKYEDLSKEEVLEKQDNYLHNYFESLNKNTPLGNDVGSGDKISNNLVENEARGVAKNERKYVYKDGKLVSITVNSYDKFVSFMFLVNDDKIAMRNRDLFRDKFERMTKWFYKEYLKMEVTDPIPPIVGGIEICLFDLYKLVQCMGGNTVMIKENKWKEAAKRFGFSGKHGEALRDCYNRYVDLLDCYYRAARENFSNLYRPNRWLQAERAEGSEKAAMKKILPGFGIEATKESVSGNGDKKSEETCAENMKQQTEKEEQRIQDSVEDNQVMRFDYKNGNKTVIVLDKNNEAGNQETEDESDPEEEPYEEDEADGYIKF